MLTVDWEQFISGVSSYYEEDLSLDSNQTSVHVNIELHGNMPIATLARLDPATPWVVLNAELNSQLGLRPSSTQIELRTVAGLMKGSLERFPITLAAEEGNALEIEATLFVCNDWRRGNFLGYSGFLQRIRFALDPLRRKFYFGPTST